MFGSPTYESWAKMKQRCFNLSNLKYKNYGGRGITVCERWLTFENFYADMGVRPEGKTLDRKNVNGNYEPSNCRWATSTEQSYNRTDSAYLEYKGVTKTMKEWAIEFDIDHRTLHKRLRYLGWTLEKALNTK